MNRLIVLNNVFEAPDSTVVTVLTTIGIDLNGNNNSVVFGTVILRGNVFRRSNGSAALANDLGIQLNGCTAATVENNVVQVVTANNAFRHQFCGTVQVFNTRSNSGVFYPGCDVGSQLHDSELTIEVENSIMTL